MDIPGISDRLLWLLPKIFVFYTVLMYNILKVTKYNWLPNTHTRNINSNNDKQKTTENVILLANGSDAPYVCEIPTAWSNN